MREALRDPQDDRVGTARGKGLIALRAAMIAPYLLTLFALVFLAAALVRLSYGGGVSHPQTRTWLLIAAIFAAVSAWLFSRG